MAPPLQPLFLARANYRKRRWRDGARLLPIFGAVLLLVPLLWPWSARVMVAHWLFIFVVWAGLIALAALVSRRVHDGEGIGDRELGSAVPPPPDES